MYAVHIHAAPPCRQIWWGKGTTCCDPQLKLTLQFVTMLGTRGRDSASGRIRARARARSTTGARSGSTVATSSGVMRATSLPSLVDRSRNVTTFTTTTPVHPCTNEIVPTTSATTLTNTGRSGAMSGSGERKELNDMMKYTKESFAIKGTPREVNMSCSNI